MRCPARPLTSSHPPGTELWLTQLCESLPWYTYPYPFGRKVYRGYKPRQRLGPVLRVVHTTPEDNYGNGETFQFVCAMLANPLYLEDYVMRELADDEPPVFLAVPEVWVNVWCNQNNKGEKVGIRYADCHFCDKPLERMNLRK